MSGVSFLRKIIGGAASATRKWQPMESAPRDGRKVHIKNTYGGVETNYHVCRWTTEGGSYNLNTGEIAPRSRSNPSWVDVDNIASDYPFEHALQWAPYEEEEDWCIEEVLGRKRG